MKIKHLYRVNVLPGENYLTLSNVLGLHIFLNVPNALANTLDKLNGNIYNLYKKLKSLDWDELEFNFISCKKDFATCDKNIYDVMIKTIAWQWEADSVVSRMVSSIGSNFTNDTYLDALWLEITRNEKVHAFTYSEIVRNSFEDPNEVLLEIINIQEAQKRLTPLVTNLTNAYEVSHKLALNIIDRESDLAYETAFLFVVSLYILERIQFMASFAITFSIAETGLFMPIGKAVQKICQDEFEVHSKADYEILVHELNTERGKNTLIKLKDNIKEMIDTTVETEKLWIDEVFADNKELLGLDKANLFKFTLFCAKDVYNTLNINSEYPLPEKNPLSFLNNWINLGNTQGSPQEERLGNYMLGMVKNDIGDEEIEIDL